MKSTAKMQLCNPIITEIISLTC